MDNDKITDYLQNKRGTKPNVKKTYSSFVVLENGKLAEEVVNPDPAFVIYDPKTNTVAVQPTVQINKQYIYPLDGDLVTKHVILFPQRAEEYEDIENLREEIAAFIHTYVDIHSFYEKLASYYVLLTWLFDKNTVITYLGIFGDYGSGKTRAAQIIGSLCYKPAFVSGALTCAPIYRLMEQARGTLVINEFDFDNSDMGIEMIKILNNGFEKGLKVLRVKNETGEIEAFDAFSPKVFTYRKKKNDQAFESRLITIPMEETKREDISIILPLEYEQEAAQIRNKLLMFRFRNYHKQVEVDQSIFQGIERRLRQTLYPLLTVIDDKVFLKTLGQFINDYQQQQQTDRGMSWIAEYLQALIALTCAESEITLKALADIYNEGKNEKDKVTPRKAGHAIRNELKLKTERITSGENKGQYKIKLDSEKIQGLCFRFGVEVPKESSLHSLRSPQNQDQSEGSEHSEGSPENHQQVISQLKPCYACGSKKFWETRFGNIVCAACHPPNKDASVVKWFEI